MLIPGTNLQGFTIKELPPVANPEVELAGAYHEVETPTGPGGTPENKGLTTEQWLAFLSNRIGGNLSPNRAKSLLKAYRYLTRAEIAANGGYGEAFENFDPNTACINTRILVAFYQPDPTKPLVHDQILVAVFDPNGYRTPEKWVYVDGSFRPGDKTPAIWVPQDAPEAQYGYVRRDSTPASITDWQLGELSIWSINGADQFATAKQAGGPFPAFTGVEDAYWKPAAAPIRGTSPGGAPVALETYTVSLSGGKTAGTIKNGDVIQKGTPYDDAWWRRVLVEDIYPTYAVAHVEVSQSAPADGEVGESVSNTITGIFFQGDAGPLTAMRGYRGNQAQIGASDTASPIVRTTQMVRSLTPTGIWAVADYAAGAKKLVTPGNTPDSRPAQVRNPNAPQAAETGLSSPVIYFNGHLNVFFGATATTPTDSDTTRALPQKQLTSAGNQGILTTGTTATQFAIAVPPGYRLLSVFDLDNQGANITSAYTAQDGLSVKDAGGTPRDYFLYLYRAAGPYPVSARHQFTYGT